MALSESGSRFWAHTPWGRLEIVSPLPGRFNVYNLLAALTAALSQGATLDQARRGLEAVHVVRGRMDRIDLGQGFTVLVDFAHTPNSLQRALETVRTMTLGKTVVVFGCAGLRDRGKRPAMGEVAGRLADRVVITAEDPRTEDLESIMEAIAMGCRAAGRREGEQFWRVGDRRQAIRHALRLAEPGDVVVITGKGHEQSICFGTTEQPWSDHAEAEQALREMLGASA
ncbi:MAG: hypothetical protein GX605_11035 [Chloroflexi bacterium]|nr:hypothetical protein [Chloroflexota bacterium]